MKKNLFIILFLLIGSTQISFAQHHGHKDKEKVKELMREIITEQLVLSKDQQTKFFPIYDEYLKEKRVQHRKVKELQSKLAVAKDSELDGSFEELFNAQEALVKLDRNYHSKFLSVLSARQVALLYKTQMHIKRKIYEHLGGKPHHKGGGHH